MDFEDFDRKRKAVLAEQADKFEKKYQDALRSLHDAAMRYASNFDAECKPTENGVTFKHKGDKLTVVVRRVPPGHDTTFDVIENGAVEKENVWQEKMMASVVDWFRRA